MLDDGGNLSIDFLAGMTIFMVALIWVANMVPGLLIGLQSRSIDLDAIAYRTGVILVEDPGMPATPSWDTLTQKSEILRFGLSASKDSPNILKLNKVEQFFCSSFSYPTDYQSRVIFGDRSYRFNISLKTFDALMTKSIGDIKPDGYGYIRRLVKIKYPSNTTIDAGLKNRRYNNTENVTYHTFSIDLNCTELIGDQPNLAYQINPRQDRIQINITNLSGARVWHKDASDTITVENIEFFRKNPSTSVFNLVTNYTDCVEYPTTCKFFTYIDGANTYNPNIPVIVNDNISMRFSPGYFYGIASDDNSQIRIKYTFRLSHADGDNFFNNSFTSPYFYNYSPSQVTQPQLKEGALEVAIW